MDRAFDFAETTPQVQQGKQRDEPEGRANRQQLTAQVLRHSIQPVDKRIWWQEANSVRIPLAIMLVIAWFFRLRTVYQEIKSTPKRSPRVRRIEGIIAASLWTFILLAVAVLFLTGHFIR